MWIWHQVPIPNSRTLFFQKRNSRLIHWHITSISKPVCDSFHPQCIEQYKMRRDWNWVPLLNRILRWIPPTSPWVPWVTKENVHILIDDTRGTGLVMNISIVWDEVVEFFLLNAIFPIGLLVDYLPIRNNNYESCGANGGHWSSLFVIRSSQYIMGNIHC